MSWTDDLSLPFDRPSMLEVPPVYRRMHESGTAARVLSPANDPAWLIANYEDVRALFGDDRVDRHHPDPEGAPRCWASGLLGRPLSPRAAAEMRKMRVHSVHGYLSAAAVRELAPRIQAITDRLIADMVAAGPPADLHAGFSAPLAVLAICEILGVPPGDRAAFGEWSDEAELLTDQARSRDAMMKLGLYCYELMRRKLAEPADDVLTRLAQGCEAGEYEEETAVMWALGLLFAGHRSSTARIDLGTLYLLDRPEARAALGGGPAAVALLVEEVLRLAGPALSIVPRWANEHLDVSGAAIEPGDLVLLAYHAANTDPAVFAEPESFNPCRDPNPHVAFGYGAHFCPGAPLARLEMQIAFQTLFRELPGLRLAGSVADLRLRDDEVSGGFWEVPVTW